MSDTIFEIVGAGRKPIPHHERHKERIFIGSAVLQYGKRIGCDTAKELCRRTRISAPIISALIGGREHNSITVGIMQRVAVVISCDLRLTDEAEEHFDVIPSTMEELFNIGIVPRFIPRQ